MARFCSQAELIRSLLQVLFADRRGITLGKQRSVEGSAMKRGERRHEPQRFIQRQCPLPLPEG
jgi:hypothetical protein